MFAQPLDLGLILGLLFLQRQRLLRQRLLLTLLFLQRLLPVLLLSLQRLLPVLLLFLFPPGKVCCLAQDQGLQGGHILGDFGDALHMAKYTRKHRNRLLFLVIKTYNTEEYSSRR